MMAGYSCLGEDLLIDAWLPPPFNKKKKKKEPMHVLLNEYR